RHRRGHGPGFRAARAGVDHPGLRCNLPRHRLRQGARAHSAAGLAAAADDPRLDRAVRRAVLAARPDRRLPGRSRGGRCRPGTRALDSAHPVRHRHRGFLRGAVRQGPRPAVQAVVTSVELFDNLALGLATAATWQNLLFCFAGVMIGTLVGVLPGISPLTTVAMLLPFTFGLSPASALIILAAIFYRP